MPTRSIQEYNNIFNTFKKEGPPTPFLLFFGNEDYLKRVGIERIEEYLGVKRLCYFGKDTTLEEILQEVSNTGLFITKKLIVIYEFEKLNQKDEIFKILPSKGTYIVLVVSSLYDKKKAKELVNKYKTLKHLTAYEFQELDYNGFLLWVKSRLNKSNKKTDDKTFNELIKRLPTSLTLADIELTKLFLYMGEDQYLDMHHLEILSYNTESSLQSTLFNIMGYEKFNLPIVAQSMANNKANETIYELETHFVRIIDAHLNTFFSDRYRAEWRLLPYKKHRMLHTLKDASCVLSRLLKIEYATKPTLHNEKITRALILFSLLP